LYLSSWVISKIGMNILFDLDGTLTDPREGIVGCIKHALVTLGQPVPSDSLLERFIGPPLQDAFRQLLAATDSQALVSEAVAAYRDRFAAVGMFENRVYSAIPHVLNAMQKRGARLFVATSKPRVFAEKILVHFELAQYFECIYGSELDGTRSDKGLLIEYALAESNLAAADTMMVGDRSHDVIGAAKNDVCPVGVLWGFGSRDELANAGASQLFDTPMDLLRLGELTECVTHEASAIRSQAT